MVSEHFDFQHPSTKYSSEATLTSMASGRDKKNGGCYVSGPIGAILLLLAIVVAVGVGLIVHFAEDNDFVCNCGIGSAGRRPNGMVPEASITEAMNECMDMATDGNSQICSRCPVTAIIATGTTVGPTTSGTETGAGTETGMGSDTRPPVDFRLPDTLIPIHYDVELQPFIYSRNPEDFTFQGHVKILIQCMKSTNRVVLQSNLLVIDRATIRFYGQNGGPQDPIFLASEYDEERQFFILHLSNNMTVNNTYNVEISFNSILPDDLRGIYYSQYTINDSPVYLMTTQFQPTDARRAFPCFDEPAMKATFNITLVRPTHYVSISNMPIINNDTTFEEGGLTYVKDVYQQTPKMSTYLLAFVICDFQYKSSYVDNGRILFRTWSEPGAVESTSYSLNLGTELLEYFEDYFGIDYVLPKEDMIAVPDFGAGGMENWGLITYREAAMLYDPLVSDEYNKQSVTIIVAHELAHQWFGNLVTPSWWDDLWLNEGFATYLEYLGTNKAHPDWNIFDQFSIWVVHDSFNVDGLISSHPLYVPVNSPEEISEIFDSITYSKGAAIVRMLMFIVGENSFRQALHNYLSSLAYGSAFHDDLWEAMRNQSSSENREVDIKGIMDTWTMQMNYPVVTVSQDFQDPRKLHMRQERFLIDRDEEDPKRYTSEFKYQWSIPITVTTSKGPRFNQTRDDIFWMTHHQTTTTYTLDAAMAPTGSDPDFWFIVNLMQYGYYRVNYHEGNWLAIMNQLNADHRVVPVINRAQVINDAWNLANAGYLDYSIALKTIEYLRNETEYVPWSAALGEISYADAMISLTSMNGLFRDYMKAMLEPLFRQFGLDNTGSSHTEITARTLIVGQACKYGVEACKDTTKQQYAQWMQNPDNNPIDVDLKYTVYCQGVQQGDWEEWKFALDMYNKTTVASEKDLLLNALSCSSKAWILQYYLNMQLLDGSVITRQDAPYAISQVASGALGKMLAWNFFRSNFDQLKSRYGSSSFIWAHVIDSLTQDFNTEFQLQELMSFSDTQRDSTGTLARAFEQAVEKTRSNIRWMELNAPKVRTWLDENGYRL